MGRRMKKSLDDVSHDELDACTAWWLARCWLDGDGVVLLGNAVTGSFLVPDRPDLQKSFEKFLQT
jgi:hypothetical protein